MYMHHTHLYICIRICMYKCPSILGHSRDWNVDLLPKVST
jgi:hypothetical protein